VKILIIIYCKTIDSSKKVGETICKANSTKTLSWKIIEEVEPDTWTIQTHCDRYIHALVYKISSSIVAIEVNSECGPNVTEPLLEKYGFENIKWLTTLEKK